MGNCLVTKLKETVNIDNLPTFGKIRLHVNYVEGAGEGASTLWLMRNPGEELTITCTSPGYFSTSYVNIETDRLTSYTLAADQDSILLYFKNAQYDVLIDKYSLKKLSNVYLSFGTKSIFSMNLNEIENTGITDIDIRNIELDGQFDSFRKTGNLTFVSLYERAATKKGEGNLSAISDKTSLTALYLIDTNINGNLSDISNLTALTGLSFTSSLQISGDIGSLGALTSLTSIELPDGGCGITGTVEDFVSKQIAAGRSSVSKDSPIYFQQLINYNASFGGKYYADPLTSLYWESASKIAVFSNTAAYTKGYTQAEAETAFPGKTIVRVDA